MTDNMKDRLKMVKAMEFIARQINDEEVFEPWLVLGVADDDIEYGDLEVTTADEELLGYYAEDDTFADLMGLFLRMMARARKNGGLYCGGISSRRIEQ